MLEPEGAEDDAAGRWGRCAVCGEAPVIITDPDEWCVICEKAWETWEASEGFSPVGAGRAQAGAPMRGRVDIELKADIRATRRLIRRRERAKALARIRALVSGGGSKRGN